MLCSNTLYSQTVILDPNGAGGFELGNTPAVNGWTVVNATAYSNWCVGNMGIVTQGVNGAFISSTPAGLDNAYTNAPSLTSAYSHIYTDVTFPVGATNITLTFKWRGVGESTFDYTNIYFLPTTTVPVTTGFPTGGNTIATNLNQQATTQTATYSLAAATYAGTTQRLCFSWKSDYSVIGLPAMSIDEVSITATLPVACSAAPTIGSATATPSGFATCSGAPTLNLTSTPAVSGITYYWQSGPTNTGPWTTLNSPQSTPGYTAPTISSNTWYQCIATCTNTNQATTSSPIQVTVTPVSVSPATASICLGSSQLLTASSPGVNGVLFSENFDAGNSMTITSSGSVGTQFRVQASPYNYIGTTNITISSPNANNFIDSDPDNNGTVGSTTNTQLTSPLLNTTNYTSLTLTYNHYFHYWSGNPAVQVSIDGGANWTSVATYTADVGTSTAFASASINLNAYVNQANFMLRFNFIDTWGWHWAIDDIVLSGTGATPNFSWIANPAGGAGLLPGAANPSPTNVTTTVTPTIAGTYTYTVTSSAPGCTTGSAVVTVTQGTTAAMSFAANPLCSGQSTMVNFTGTPNATVTYKVGAGPNQTVVLSAAGTASVSTGALATSTTYTLVSVSLNGCTTTYNTTQTITVNTSPVFNAGMPSSNSPVCSGTAMNLFSATTPASTSYSWTGPAFGTPNNSQNPVVPNAQVSYSGVYTVTAMTAQNCSVTGTTTVTVNQSPTVTVIGFLNPTSCGGTQGTITLSALTPSTTYTLNYTNGVSYTTTITSTAGGQYVMTGLTAGTYTSIYVTLNGCNSPIAGPVTLTDPAPPNISGVTTVSPTVCTGTNGSFTISGLLSNTNYTFSYNNNTPVSITTNVSGSYTKTGLPAGTYNNIYVVRNNCTSNVMTAVITDPNPPVITSITSTNPTTCGGTQGTITLHVTDAAAAPITGSCTVHYTSSVTGAQTVPLTAVSGVMTITGLPAASYTNFYFTSPLNCSSVTTPGPVVLNDPAAPVISSTNTTTPTTCGGANGSIILHGLLATTAYSVYYNGNGPLALTSNASGDITIANVSAGTYNNIYVVRISCTSNVVNGVVVSDPAPPVIGSTSSANPSQCLVADGSITLAGLVPNTSYVVSYFNGLTTTTTTITSGGTGNVVINGLLAAMYSNINVKLNNCQSANVGPILLTDPGAPTITAVSNAPICEGQTLNFTSTVTQNNNTVIANSYTWTGPGFVNPVNQANPSIPNALATASGVYTVTAMVGNCTAAPFLLPVTVYAAPTPPALSVNTPLCSGNALHFDVQNPDSTYMYIWTGPAFATPDTNTSITINNATVNHSGLYYVSVTNPYGCSLLTPSTVNVVVNQSPNAPVPDDVVACQADVPVALTATPSGNPADTLKWYTVPTGGTGTTIAPVPPTTTAGTFTWYVSQTTQAGCEGPRAMQTVLVKTKPLPPITNTPAFTYCQQDSSAVALSANGDSLKWYTVATGGTPSFIAPVPQTTTAGVTLYYVSQTKEGCESDRLAISVTVITKPQPPVVSDVRYCQYDLATALTAIGQNLQWYDNPQALNPLPAAPIPSTQTPGATTWYVSQTINNCESNLAAITVNIYFHPTADIKASREEVCQGDTLLISYAGNGTTTATYNWGWPSSSSILNGNGQGPYVVRFNAVGMQTITLIATENGCTSPMASHSIKVKQTPEVEIGLRNNIVCTDEPAYLELKRVTMETSYLWDFGGGHTAEGYTQGNGSGPYYVLWSNPGKYTVSLSATSEENCSATATDTVNVHAHPEAKINGGTSDEICSGEDVELSASVNNSKYTYKWLPTAQFDYDYNSPIVKAHADKTGYITLEVTNEYGCTSKDSVMLNTKPCCELSLPSAFSPNGDGRNDLFRIINEGRHRLKSLRVYNRYGQMVWSTSSEKDGWNGAMNGVAQEMGVYQYIVEYYCEGKLTTLKGEVTLIR